MQCNPLQKAQQDKAGGTTFIGNSCNSKPECRKRAITKIKTGYMAIVSLKKHGSIREVSLFFVCSLHEPKTSLQKLVLKAA